MANSLHDPVTNQFLKGGTDTRPKSKRCPGSKRMEMLKHAYDFERITHKLLLRIANDLGLDDNDKPDHAIGSNGHASAIVQNGENRGEESSKSSEISRDTAQIIVGLARSWDLSAERVRILKGVPMPGSRRPSEAIPKPRKPANKPPDTLSEG